MAFNAKQIERLVTDYEKLAPKRDALASAFIGREYIVSRAEEFAHHGFLRRVKTLLRCIENVFALLPPQQADIPKNEDRQDAEINIQASVLNTFGCLDNLAWIWVKEKKVTKADGSPLPRGWVGLRKSNKDVHDTFSKEFQEYIITIDDWFGQLVDFRDALAHRIPLYIPPYAIAKDNQEDYRKLDEQKWKAGMSGDSAEYDRLHTEQMALVAFQPVMQHSYFEETNSLAFHPQLIANFLTIDELGHKILEELER